MPVSGKILVAERAAEGKLSSQLPIALSTCSDGFTCGPPSAEEPQLAMGKRLGASSGILSFGEFASC